MMLRSSLTKSFISHRFITTVARQDNKNKKKVIVLGAGWSVEICFNKIYLFTCFFDRGGFQFVRYLNRNKYDVTLVSSMFAFVYCLLYKINPNV
mgnify:FL=1